MMANTECRYLARCSALAIMLALTPGAAASPPEFTLAQSSTDETDDVPIGAPYRAGSRNPDSGANASVPLRDYLSSRIDQLRSELLDRLETREKQLQAIIDERETQYAQRFSAQQEAIKKSEETLNKRFDSVNEFRQTLTDQALTFMSKAEADARFKALEEKATNNSARLDDIKSRGEGENNLWAYLLAVLGALGLIATFVMNFNKSRSHAV